MKIPLSLVAAGCALLIPIVAQAQPGLPPGLNPAITNQAAQRAQQSDVAYWYSVLPPQVFGSLGNVDRMDLLQNNSTIYDKNGGFIEVMAPGDANKNDVEKLQVKLYRGNQGLMVGVSQIVWNQPRLKGALAFFALGQDGQLIDVTQQVFPFDWSATQTKDNAADAPQNDGADGNAGADATDQGATTLNAYLPRKGTTITTAMPESDVAVNEYSWDGNAFFEQPAQDAAQN